MFLEFESTDTQKPIWINPAHVTSVQPSTKDSSWTVVYFVSGHRATLNTLYTVVLSKFEQIL